MNEGLKPFPTDQNNKFNTSAQTDIQKAFEPVIHFFGQQLRSPDFSDGDARAEFFAVARGVEPQIQRALFNQLLFHRPQAAEFTIEELDRGLK